MRENEDAAMALGVDAITVKLAAMVVSGAITAAAGCFYAQYFLFVDSGIAYGTWISIEALLTPIIGGVGTVFGPLLGALVVKALGEGALMVTGDAPGPRPRGLWRGAGAGDLVHAARADRRPRRAAPADSAARDRPRWRRRPVMAEPLLSVERVSRRFGGLLAVNEVSLSAAEGRITALIGPNGAGKTTLFAVISGFLKPSDGAVRYAGEDVTGEPPHRLARRGIARTFQIVQPFAGLVGAREHHGRRASASPRARRRACLPPKQVGRELGLADMLDRPAGTLTVAGRKRLELAKALATEPKLLLLDEVLAGLNPSEIRDVVPVIRALCARGITIMMIEHVMQAVMSLAEHVFVLAEGRIIADGTPARGGGRSRRGRGLSRPRRGGQAGSGAWPLTRCSTFTACTPATAKPRCCAASILVVEPGEIVAVLGSNGVGKSTLNRTISGILRARSGSIRFDGAAIEHEKPPAIVKRGLIHVPEGRRIFPNLSVRENLDLGSLRPRRGKPRAQPRARVRDFPAPGRAPRASSPARCRAASSRCSPSAAG